MINVNFFLIGACYADKNPIESSNCLLLSRLKLTSSSGSVLNQASIKNFVLGSILERSRSFHKFYLTIVSRDIIATCYSLFLRFSVLKFILYTRGSNSKCHSLQLTAENETRLLLSRYYVMLNSHIEKFRHFGFDKDSESSLTLQQEGLNLYCIQNVKVLQSIGFNSYQLNYQGSLFKRTEKFFQKNIQYLSTMRYSFSFITGKLVLFFIFYHFKDFIQYYQHIRTTFNQTKRCYPQANISSRIC